MPSGSDDPESGLILERHGATALLTIDRPASGNALGVATAHRLVDALGELEADEDIRALVLTGAGQTFCAGADLGELEDAIIGDGADVIYDAFERLAGSGLVTLAAVNGPAIGAGLNLALACDVRVVTPSARFGARFLDLALHPGGGHAWFVTRCFPSDAVGAVVLLGEEIEGVRLVELGAALECVPPSDLLLRCLELAGKAASRPKELLARVKAALREAPRSTLAEVARNERIAQRWSAEQPEFRVRVARLRNR